ncbi:MAG: xanthine dehydrogenase accessory protein XdhC [Pleurocapsa sp. SU_196_0]|nr:xanthine dehydrogenase accessory protein XdhC [Pleurocapsa sp. SU_196_0]
MPWFEDLERLTAAHIPCVIVTVLSVRGHAPREPGAKMLVTAEHVLGTIGGGNLEAMAIERARGKLEAGDDELSRFVQRLTHEDSLYGVQCCGGEVEVLLETVRPIRPVIVIFGVGHVGLALAKIMALFDVELWLVDSRNDMLAPERLERLHHEAARVRVFLEPMLDGAVLSLPGGAHALVMTHDHAEDLHVLKALLSRDDLGYVGLIGSGAKWTRFKRKLLEADIAEERLARVTTPIGLAGVPGKAPQAIAVAVAAQLVGVLHASNQSRDQLNDPIGKDPRAT